MPGLVPGIHAYRTDSKVVDGRDKPGQDTSCFLEKRTNMVYN